MNQDEAGRRRLREAKEREERYLELEHDRLNKKADTEEKGLKREPAEVEGGVLDMPADHFGANPAKKSRGPEDDGPEENLAQNEPMQDVQVEAASAGEVDAPMGQQDLDYVFRVGPRDGGLSFSQTGTATSASSSPVGIATSASSSRVGIATSASSSRVGIATSASSLQEDVVPEGRGSVYDISAINVACANRQRFDDVDEKIQALSMLLGNISIYEPTACPG
jgi:hypothetical protein